MATNKLTKSLRNSVAAEAKSVAGRTDNPVTAKPDVTEPKVIAVSPLISKPTQPQSSMTKPAATTTQKTATVTTSTAKPAAKTPAKKISVAPQPNNTAKKPAAATAKTTPAKAKVKTAKKVVKSSVTKPTAKKTSSSMPDNLAASLAHNKLHHIVDTHYHLYETYLENLQKVNDNLHDYLNQLVEINNLNSLIKLNLSYLSSAPLRCQEMIAQNKNIFSNFFKFALPNEK